MKNRFLALAVLCSVAGGSAGASPNSTTLHLRAFDQDLPAGTKVSLRVAPVLKVLGGTAPPEHGPDGKLLPPKPFFLVDEPAQQVLEWEYVTKPGSREGKSVDCSFPVDIESIFAIGTSRRAVTELPATFEFSSLQEDGTWRVERTGETVFGLFVQEPASNSLTGCLRLYHREEGFGIGVAYGCEPKDFEGMLRRVSCPTGDCPKIK